MHISSIKKFHFRLVASLHYNENKGRNQAKTKERIRRFSIHFPKYKKGAYICSKMEDSKITSGTV